MEMNDMKGAGLALAVLLINGFMVCHSSLILEHELFRREISTADLCTVDDCIVDDECITEDAFKAGTFEDCYTEMLQIGFNQRTVTVEEDAGGVTLNIELNQNASVFKPVTVTYLTLDPAGVANAATRNVDYTTVNDEVVFAVGEYIKNITIPILPDLEREGEEIFYVELASECCADIVNRQAQVRIVDANEDSSDSQITILIASVVGSVLGLLIIGICAIAIIIIMIRKRKTQKMTPVSSPTVLKAPTQNNEMKDSNDNDTEDYVNDDTDDKTSLKMLTVVKSYMEILKMESNDLFEMLLPSNEVKFIDIIGEGTFGCVYKGTWNHGNSVNEMKISETVAIKSLKNFDSLESLRSILHESNIMKKFNHPNVLPIIGVCLGSDHEKGLPFMVLPFMANGDLKSYLKSHRTKDEVVNQLPQGIKQNNLLDMCYQIACGMNYLAMKRFVHRDLAARNCMVDESLNIKVADFGLARDIYVADYYRHQRNGKIPVKWMAPEALNDKISNQKTDVWSYGITCWEVFSLGRTPYPTVSNHEILRHVESGNRPEKPILCPDNMYTLMLKCWELNASSRLNFEEIMEELSDLIRYI